MQQVGSPSNFADVRASSASSDVPAQIKLWLSAIHALLVAIEDTARRARAFGGATRAAVDALYGFRAGSDPGDGTVPGLRDLTHELFAWPVRLSRLTSTALVLGRVATAYRLHTTQAAFMSEQRAARAREKLHRESARRLYLLSVRHGGAFLKLGQMLSSRPDLLPQAYVKELGKLQDAAPAVPFRDIARVIERELGRPVSEVFAAFEEKPVAAASIGQVHRARLASGLEVAVKVQRPNIESLVTLDMELLELFVQALAQGLPPLDFDTIIRETRDARYWRRACSKPTRTPATCWQISQAT